MMCNHVPLIELFHGELVPSREDQVMAHLGDCTICRQRFKTMAIIGVAARLDNSRIWPVQARADINRKR